MDEFDRSPEDISFDLNAEEFSLESILDEYKDFQTENRRRVRARLTAAAPSQQR